MICEIVRSYTVYVYDVAERQPVNTTLNGTPFL